KLKEYVVEFEDVVKYRFKVNAEDELDAKSKISCMSSYDEYEVDRREYSSTKASEYDDKIKCDRCGSDDLVVFMSNGKNTAITYRCEECDNFINVYKIKGGI
ncbi:MAG: hypothetical protein RR359_03385, partial [Bacilli bacterium]